MTASVLFEDKKFWSGSRCRSTSAKSSRCGERHRLLPSEGLLHRPFTIFVLIVFVSMEDKLKKWGFEAYIAKFQDEEITLNVLMVMKEAPV